MWSVVCLPLKETPTLTLNSSCRWVVSGHCLINCRDLVMYVPSIINGVTCPYFQTSKLRIGHQVPSFIYCPAVCFTRTDTSSLSVKGCKIWSIARYLRPLVREGSLSCHTCCDTGPRFLWSHPKELPSLAAYYDE